MAWTDLADVLAGEIRLLRAAEAELARHADAREQAYQTVEPDGLTRSCQASPTSAAR